MTAATSRQFSVRDPSGNGFGPVFDVSAASFVDAFSVSSQDTVPTGVAFSPGGTKMFVTGDIGEDVNEYALAAAFDVSTASFVDAFSVGSEDDGPTGVAFSPGGTRMFVTGSIGSDVNEYALGTAFDVSTASFVDAFSVRSEDDAPTGVAFSSDGTRMFMTGFYGQDVNEYALAAAFDVSTASFVHAFSVASQETIPLGIAFSADGTRMFVTGDDGDSVNEYALGTAFDVLTASFVDALSVASQDTSPQDVAFSTDGTRMFVVGRAGGDVNEYALGATFGIALTGTPPGTAAPAFSSATLDRGTGALEITFDETIDATNIDAARFHIRESGTPAGGTTLSAAELGTTADSATVSFTLTAANLRAVNALAAPELTIDPSAVRDPSGNGFAATFDVSTASFVDAFSVASQDTSPQDVAFSADGTKMFVAGAAGSNVNEYALGTAFDVSTASFVDAFSVGSEGIVPTGVAFSPDRTRMFVVGTPGRGVSEYALGTAFDVSTASFTHAFSVASQDTSPQDVAVSADGAKMFVVGNQNDNVYEYALASAFDVSTASFTHAFSVASQDGFPTGVAFSPGGTKMFVTGFGGEDVNEYALGTAFDVSTASFVDAFSVSSQETHPQGVAFSPDGTKMFVTGDNGDDVNEYALSSAFAIAMTGTPPDITAPFITTWRTTASNQTVTFPGTGAYHIDWGDGDTDAATGTVSHTYAGAGTYTVAAAGGLTRFNLGDGASDEANGDRLQSIGQWGNMTWTTMETAFEDADSLTYNATDAPDLSGVTDMSGMFHGASKFDGDLSSWDVSGVTDMEEMFRASAFNGDVSGWNVSSVTDMNGMFTSAAAFNQPLDSWDVSQVTDMDRMFREAVSFNQPLDSWDVSQVTDMNGMFTSAASFDQPLDSWDVSQVTDMDRMFREAASFNQPLDSWDVSSVTNMHGMFGRAAAFDGDISSWNVSSVIYMSSMFRSASSFNQPLDSWDVSSVTDMNGMFIGAAAFDRPLNLLGRLVGHRHGSHVPGSRLLQPAPGLLGRIVSHQHARHVRPRRRL